MSRRPNPQRRIQEMKMIRSYCIWERKNGDGCRSCIFGNGSDNFNGYRYYGCSFYGKIPEQWNTKEVEKKNEKPV